MTRQEWMERQDWYKRWQQRVAQAWSDGVMDHTKELEAPMCTPARYGYLVQLTTPETQQAYTAEKRRLGVHGGLSDLQRYAWEDRYISNLRQNQKEPRQTGREFGGANDRRKNRNLSRTV